MNELTEILVITYAPHYGYWRNVIGPKVAVEFWRGNSTYKEFDEVSRKQFERLLPLLKDYAKSATTEVSKDSLITNFKIR
jgi:hypothetical protein